MNRLIRLVPGTVLPSRRVLNALRSPAMYHRSSEFLTVFARVKDRLRTMVGGAHLCTLMVGSGTLANMAVARALRARFADTLGLIVSNGEFGQRLHEIATSQGLAHDVHDAGWGCPVDMDMLEVAVRELPPKSWIWMVHHETSAGLNNDIASVRVLATSLGHELAVDCVSSIGGEWVDLDGILLASASSAKAIGSVAGLAMVWSRVGAFSPRTRGQEYLDLDVSPTDGPLHTFPSQLVMALDVALRDRHSRHDLVRRESWLRRCGERLRATLMACGARPLPVGGHANPHTITFRPPSGCGCADVRGLLRHRDVEIGGASSYLQGRELLQVSAMGGVTEDDVTRFGERLKDVVDVLCSSSRRSPTSVLSVSARRRDGTCA